MELTEESIRDAEEDFESEDLIWILKEEEDFQDLLKAKGFKL